jgi:uncharacterized Rmd1/YagE family protein
MSSCITAPAIDEQTHHETHEETPLKKPRLSQKAERTTIHQNSQNKTSQHLSLSQKPTIFKTQNYRMHNVLRFFKNPRTFLAPEEEEEDKEALEASKRIWTPVGKSCDQIRDKRIR